MDPIGTFHTWGFTSALDLIEIHRAVWSSDVDILNSTATNSNDQNGTNILCNAKTSREEEKKPLNVLLIHVGDIRHVLKTAAQRLRHTNRPIHFYIFDRPIETIARHMLLISVAFDWTVPLRRRVNTWLEIYGNSKLPLRASKYVARQRLRLIEILTNSQGNSIVSHHTQSMDDADKRGDIERRMAVRILQRAIDLSLLRYKERDQLETTISAWSHTAPFDVETLRDQRVRHSMEQRYDFRDNLFDWDYHMTIRPQNGIIHKRNYKSWRDTGIAFEFGDVTYTEPNRTLSSYVEGRERGRSTLRRGFWADIVCSPYHAIGSAAFTGDPTYLGTDKTTQEKINKTREAASSKATTGSASSNTELGYIGSDSAAAIFPKTHQRPPIVHNVKYREGIDPMNAIQLARELMMIVHRKSGSEQFRHTAMELSVYNVLSWLFEFETGRMYALQQSHEIYSGLGELRQSNKPSTKQTKSPTTKVNDTLTDVSRPNTSGNPTSTSNPNPSPSRSPNPNPSVPHEELQKSVTSKRAVSHAQVLHRNLNSIRIIPFTGNIESLLRKVQHSNESVNLAKVEDHTAVTSMSAAAATKHILSNKFDVVVVGSRAAHLLDPDYQDDETVASRKPASQNPNTRSSKYDPTKVSPLVHILSPRATIILETARNVVNVKEHLRQEFERRIIGMGLGLGATMAGTGRLLSGDTYTVGTVIATSKKSSQTTSVQTKLAAMRRYEDHAPALCYIQQEIDHRDPRGGDNPSAEHVVFEWDETKAQRRRDLYSQVTEALAQAKHQKTQNESKTSSST